MVGIIVIDIGTIKLTLKLQAAISTGEGSKASRHSIAGDTQQPSGTGRSQRIEDIVPP